MSEIRADQMSDATPCEDWDVRTVADHLVRANLRFAAAVVGGASSSDLPDDLLGADPAEAYQSATAAVTTAMSADGAAEQMLPNGMTVEMMYQIVVTEQVLHGWDLAKATGQGTDLDPDLVAITHGIVGPAIEAGLGADAYATAIDVSDDASAQQRLLALVGRVS